MKLDAGRFNNVDLHYSIFTDSDIPMASFCNSQLRSCHFISCNALLADFSASDLTSAQFDNSILSGAIFKDANLKDVSFEMLQIFIFNPIMNLANPRLCADFDCNEENIPKAFEMAWDAIKL